MAVDRVAMTKAAAEALRMVPVLAKENADLKKENAELKREKKIAKLAGLLVDKKQIGEQELPTKIAELSGKTDDELERIEYALHLISPSGSIKLGTVVGGANGAEAGAALDVEDRFHQFLLTGGDESGE